MDKQQKDLVNAVLAAVTDHEHPTLLRQALTYGFALVEEEGTTWYDAPETAEAVSEILPKAHAYVQMLKAEFSGTAATPSEPPVDPPAGLTEEELLTIQHLASAPALGPSRSPATNGNNDGGNATDESSGGPLSEEALRRIQQLSA